MSPTVPQIIKKHSRIQWVKVNDLLTGQPYQRPVTPQQVHKLAANFDPNLLGTLVVAERDDGSFWVIDGQHRIGALKQIGWHEQEVPCVVLKDIDYNDEAALHGWYNENRRQHTPIDLYVSFLEAGHVEEQGIEKILNKHGLHVSTDTQEGCVRAVQACRALYTFDPDMLDRVLSVTIAAWGKAYDSFNGDVMRGIGLVLAHYPKTLDTRKLISSLKDTRPTSIILKAREQHRINYAPHVNNVAAVIVADYNHVKGGRKLPPATDLLRPRTHTLLAKRPLLTTETKANMVRDYTTDLTSTFKSLAAKYGVPYSLVAGALRGMRTPDQMTKATSLLRTATSPAAKKKVVGK